MDIAIFVSPSISEHGAVSENSLKSFQVGSKNKYETGERSCLITSNFQWRTFLSFGWVSKRLMLSPFLGLRRGLLWLRPLELRS